MGQTKKILTTTIKKAHQGTQNVYKDAKWQGNEAKKCKKLPSHYLDPYPVN